MKFHSFLPALVLVGVLSLQQVYCQTSFRSVFNRSKEQKSLKEVLARTRMNNPFISSPSHRFFTGFFNSNGTDKNDADTLSNGKMLLTAITGSVLFGIMGALIGYSYRARKHHGFFTTTIGDGERARKGAAIGGAIGGILGFLVHREKIRQKYPFVRIIIGSILGGVAGYKLIDMSFGVSALLLPPIGANIILYL